MTFFLSLTNKQKRQDYCIQCYATHLGWKLSWSRHAHERRGMMNDDAWCVLMDHVNLLCYPQSKILSYWLIVTKVENRWTCTQNLHSVYQSNIFKAFCIILLGLLGPWLWSPWQFELGLGMWVLSHVCSWPTLWWKASLQRLFFLPGLYIYIYIAGSHDLIWWKNHEKLCQ